MSDQSTRIAATPDCCFHPDSSCTWVGEVRVEHSREVGELLREIERLRESIGRLHAPIQWSSGTYCEECGDEFPCLTRRITDHERVPVATSKHHEQEPADD